VITGERGDGKSMYAYKTMAKIYYDINGYNKTDDEEEAYKQALDHMIFSMEELILLIHNNIKNDYVTPVFCLDDATVHFCSYKYFTDMKKVVYVHGIFDTIRTAVTGLLMTCPKRKLLLKFLRQYDDLKIRIIVANGQWWRYARAYRWNWLPDEKKFNIAVPFQDNFSCYVHDDYYKPYMKKRKAALKDMDDEMMKALKLSEKMGAEKMDIL